MGFGRKGWPLLIGEGRRYLEANVLWMFRDRCCCLLDRAHDPAWAGSTSACSSFGSPRKDKGREIQTLHFLSGPGRFPQKLQAGFHGRVAFETIKFPNTPSMVNIRNRHLVFDFELINLAYASIIPKQVTVSAMSYILRLPNLTASSGICKIAIPFFANIYWPQQASILSIETTNTALKKDLVPYFLK